MLNTGLGTGVARMKITFRKEHFGNLRSSWASCSWTLWAPSSALGKHLSCLDTSTVRKQAEAVACVLLFSPTLLQRGSGLLPITGDQGNLHRVCECSCGSERQGLRERSNLTIP